MLKSKDLRPAVNILFDRMPLTERVVVKVVPSKSPSLDKGRAWGVCYKTKKGFQIYLDSSMNKFHALDVLAHEWAHAFCWTEQPETVQAHHGPEFGVAWARAHCAIYNEDFSPCRTSHPLTEGQRQEAAYPRGCGSSSCSKVVGNSLVCHKAPRASRHKRHRAASKARSRSPRCR